jgi:hypothetical protein
MNTIENIIWYIKGINIRFIKNIHNDEDKENIYEIGYSLLRIYAINSSKIYILIDNNKTWFNSFFE